jgi:uncharacterized protein YmfQ (DUF2313 family)
MISTFSDHLEIFTRYYLPSGKAWNSKNISGSNMRNLASGFCEEYRRSDLSLYNFKQEMMPDTTDEYIGRWEQAVGIPCDCFQVAGDLATRRLNVQRKLSLLGLQTSSDFENFAASMGLAIKARSGIDHVSTGDGGYGTELPAIDIPSEFATVKEARFTIVITSLVSPAAFDYDFDFPFGNSEQLIMECVFRHAKPGNCNIIFTTE